MVYNLTTASNSTSLYAMSHGVNDALSGWPMMLVLISFFIVLLAMFMYRGFINATLASSFIITLLTGISWTLGFVNFYFIFLPLIVLIVSVIIKMLE